LQEINTRNEKNKLNKRKRNSDKTTLDENKYLIEEHKQNRQEKYEQLMHLLNKSKFYSNYLLHKFNKSMEKVKIVQKTSEHSDNDENILLKKCQVNYIAEVSKYNVEEYLFANVSNMKIFCCNLLIFNYMCIL